VLWVGQVSPHLKEIDLQEEFGAYGQVAKVHMVPKSNCAFVYMDNAESAGTALKALNNKCLIDMNLRITFAKKRVDPKGASGGAAKGPIDTKATRSLLLEQIATCTCLELQEACEAHAKVISCKIQTRSEPVKAFVEFKTARDAVTVKAALDGTAVFSTPRIKVTYSQGKVSRKLWVGSVTPNCSEQQLNEAFAKFGTVESFALKRESNCAFVYMKELKAAVSAAEALHGTAVGGAQCIKVEFCESSDKPRASGKGGSGGKAEKTVNKPTDKAKTILRSGRTTRASEAAVVPLPKPKPAV